jgi:hypothetical protein
MIPRFFLHIGKASNCLNYIILQSISLHKYNPNDTIHIYTSLYESDKFVEWNSCEHNTKINNKIKLVV